MGSATQGKKKLVDLKNPGWHYSKTRRWSLTLDAVSLVEWLGIDVVLRFNCAYRCAAAVKKTRGDFQTSVQGRVSTLVPILPERRELFWEETNSCKRDRKRNTEDLCTEANWLWLARSGAPKGLGESDRDAKYSLSSRTPFYKALGSSTRRKWSKLINYWPFWTPEC